MGMGMGKDFGSHSSVEVHKVTDPSDAIQQVVNQNAQVKADNERLQLQIQTLAGQNQALQEEMKHLGQFRQILQNPIEKLSIEFHDEELLRKIRGRMIKMFGRGGHMDADGKWAQTVVNKRFQLVVRQLMYNGLQRWPQVEAQLGEIIKQQGLAMQ